MKKLLAKIGLISSAVVTLYGCGGGGDLPPVSSYGAADDPAKTVIDQASPEHPLATTPLLACIGDVDAPTNGCFRGAVLNTQTGFNWQYVSGGGFWNGSAKYTQKISPNNNSATWTFLVTTPGDVWFSAWIPSTNATAKSVYYTVTCRGNAAFGNYEYNSLSKNVNQLNYSAQWVTLVNIGTFTAGSLCTVVANKLDQGPGFLSASALSSKMAADGIKMSVY